MNKITELLIAAGFFFVPSAYITTLDFLLDAPISYYKYNTSCIKISNSDNYVCEKITSNNLIYEECQRNIIFYQWWTILSVDEFEEEIAE